jgi:phosphonate transport system substrate-binding protein
MKVGFYLVPVGFLGFLLLTGGCGSGGGSDQQPSAEAKPANPGDPAPPKPNLGLAKLVVALKPNKNPDAMLEEKKALEDTLSKLTGVPVEVLIPLSSAVINEGFANGTVDLGYLSSTEMATARGTGAADVLLAGLIDGKTTYESYWLTLQDKPYASIADLKGKPIAFASKTSTSGYIIPYSDLLDRGLLKAGETPEAFFGEGNVFYGTGYVSAIEKVFSGEAEAAAVSDYVLNKDKHLPDPAQRARLKKLQAQGPVPTHIIAVRTSVPPEDRELIRQALLKLNDSQFQTLRDKVFTSQLIVVDPDRHLAPIAHALSNTGLASQ